MPTMIDRHIVRCPYCKSSFAIEGRTPWQRSFSDVLELVEGHAATCPKTEIRLRFRIAPYRLDDPIFPAFTDPKRRQLAAFDLLSCDWKVSQVKGTTNPAVKCDGRCTHAKGPNCDCSCGGKNHGSQL
jgi:hypothetical protein